MRLPPSLLASYRRWLSLWLVLLLVISPGLGAGWDFSAISTRTERLYGPATPAARQRIDEWGALLKQPSQGTIHDTLGNDSNLLIVFYVQIMPDDFVMQLHRF
ncbi:hypothetical protein [Leclercia sp. W6]|uniref:hypothetical protein n=1 Tax=Leclercia sp. W6 TaxID=2282310 RepID=UPI0011C06072|nr:hypothetical protein [Leclercia sp. W6]